MRSLGVREASKYSAQADRIWIYEYEVILIDLIDIQNPQSVGDE